ncbi:hypothetical protein [Fimbriiglobus ruber]|uniref:hypothetical protein n=1 Tax=Fimbriiglobus ruber TaxID=1908690 RepID=UPI000B4C19A3|nr:hypothetical protein [Fimbriiglobus ruber]
MVRFPITLVNLQAKINTVDNTWLTRAATQTAAIAAGTAFPMFPGFWSDIKEVYMELQGSKCAYCEKWLEDERIEHDVEHFRPKNPVRPWKIPADIARLGIVVQQPVTGTEPGYRFFAYNPLNYASACKTCNTILKKNYFPIAGIRDSDAVDPAAVGGEQAFLIYPIGDIDADPETLIEFSGLNPQARSPSGRDKLRAAVTIKIFRLDDWRKGKELNKDRAEFIEKLFWALRLRDNPSSSVDEVDAANQAIKRLTGRKFRHANCLRSYRRLWETNRLEAEAIAARVRKFLRSSSKRRRGR